MPSTQARTKHFELLLEAGKLLSSKLDLSELLNTIMQLAARVVNAETASLLLVDPETDELYFDVALGLAPEVHNIRLKMGEGIAGSVAQSATPMIINDVTKDPRWSPKIDEDSGFKTRSILAAPIILKGKRIGVVEAINHIEGDFSFTDLRIFEAFASQAGVAIENARLFSSLKEEKSKLATLLDEIRDAALLTDAAGGVILANGAARRFLGDSEAPARFETAVAGMKLNPPLERILRSDDDIVEFAAIREEPKKLVLAGTASLIRDGRTGETSGRVIVFRDVTEERHEEGLKRNFLSLISHKLKTPLASITGYSQLLLDDLKKQDAGANDFQVSALGTVYTQGQKLNGLVDKLLNYTVMEELEAAEIDKKGFPVDDVLKQAVKASQPWLQNCGASVALEPDSGLAAVGDPGLVRDVVRNLIENGIKFSSGESRSVSIWATPRSGGVEIHVRDSGPGIPPEEQDKIFQKFYQIDASFTGQVEGWGLGLSFVRKVVEKLDGAVRLESTVGAGSTFIITLPVAETCD
ncbi:MAG: GAF domain-containing sensor histidine kinase [Elusimicrobiota bacterium]